MIRPPQPRPAHGDRDEALYQVGVQHQKDEGRGPAEGGQEEKKSWLAHVREELNQLSN